jgi:hypothetical protein
MKSLAAGVLAGLLAFPVFAETVKITVECGSSSRVYLVSAGETRLFDNIKKMSFPATEGDCSGYDTSMLVREVKDGDGLRMSASVPVDGAMFVSLDYEYYKFLGTQAHSFTARCVVNNPSSDIETFSQTIVLRKGAPPLLLRGTPEMKVFGAIVEQ